MRGLVGSAVRRWGFWAGPALFALTRLAPAPAGLSADAWVVAALALWMAAWWFTEAVPISATALLPFVVLPLAGVARAEEVASAYFSPIIFLVLGGALVALAIEKAGLHRRLALRVARAGPANLRGLTLTLMVATAIVSMGVSNTATALIMMPVALALVAGARDALGEAADRWAAAMVLGVAYAASIGGLGTLVGSPTNAIAAGLMERTLGIDVSFLTWAMFGLPVVLLGVPAAAFVLNRLHRVPGAAVDRAAVLAAVGAPGPMTAFERRLLPFLALLLFGWTVLPFLKERLGLARADDAVVVVAVALMLFVAKRERGGAPMLEAADVARAPWDVLLLFGGGLALADAITDTGLALWLGQHLGGVGAWPVWVAAAVVVALLIVVTEFASNVATASGFIPVIAGVVAATGADPWLLAMPAALAASWGFMMPAGTGPNAIAYATGRVSVAQMIRAGLLVNLVGVPLIVGACFAVAALRGGG